MSNTTSAANEPTQLNNVRVLSTTYEKLLITITEDQANLIRGIQGIVVKEKTTEGSEYGVSYTIAVKVISDRLCDLYKTIKRRDIIKGCYDIAIMPVLWRYEGKSGFRIDAYMIKKLESIVRINPLIQRVISESKK